MNTQRNAENTAVELRARLRQARAELASDQRSRGNLLMRARLFTWLNVAREQAQEAGLPKPSRIAAFWPMADEPDLLPLLSQWADADDITLTASGAVDTFSGVIIYSDTSPDNSLLYYIDLDQDVDLEASDQLLLAIGSDGLMTTEVAP